MPLIRYACSHCGTWQPWFSHESPPGCPTCMDVRNALPESGWNFRSAGQVSELLTTSWAEALPGILGFHCTPAFGLGSTGWLLRRPEGNVAFEGAPWYSRGALEHIASLGGIRVLSASHPHGFGALWQLQERFDPLLVLHRDAIPYTKAFQVRWPVDGVHEVAPGLTLHPIGGHYEGQCALYDAATRSLFCGDALKVELGPQGEPTGLSCHKGFHYAIPMSHGELRHYRAVFEQLPFENVFTPFEFARGVTRAHALALFDRLLAGRPHTQPIPMRELS
ncbi:MBL fold metallo-hydrolase [Stigmatella hybrida]|uniref:MBL fold metallo-hydrolase n=1 Tax=Stigmatella hybrida TaxID=394097 RepID=UPI001CDA7066|nr:MBL fold metallo-hydrolase [Stigmatella hybrida]